MDGVLFDSTVAHARAYDAVLTGAGIAMPPYETLAGRSTRDALSSILGEGDARLEELVRAKQRRALAEIAAHGAVFPGAVEAIRACRDRGVLTALATSASAGTCTAFLDRLEVEAPFQAVVNGDGRRGKPAPDIFLEAGASLGTPMEQTWVVEDSVAGVTAGIAAGAQVVAVTGTHDRQALVAAGAEGVVESVAELPALLASAPTVGGVIPAGGMGTRLGHDGPKPLFPILNRPMFEHVADAVSRVAAPGVIVASPQMAAILSRDGAPAGWLVTTQETPTGNLDAIVLGAMASTAEHILVVWADQAAISVETLRRLMLTHVRSDADLTLGTVQQQDPYIHLELDGAGSVVRSLQRREGHEMPGIGTSDVGAFVIRRDWLLGVAPNLAGAMGGSTAEPNIIDALPELARLGRMRSVQAADAREAIGVNTPDEAKVVEAVLMERCR